MELNFSWGNDGRGWVDGTTGVFSIHGTVFDLGLAYTESVRTSVSASGRGCTEKSSLKSCKRIRASKPDGVSLSNKMVEPGGTAFPFQLSLMPYNGAPSSLKNIAPERPLNFYPPATNASAICFEKRYASESPVGYKIKIVCGRR